MLTPASYDVRRLGAQLRSELRGTVGDDATAKGLYAVDASNYRVVPDLVVVPADVDDLAAAVLLTAAAGAPVTLRGGGTSMAGNAIGGVVIDASRHVNRIVDIDAAAGTAVVEPGVVLTSLLAAARPHRLTFGADPSSASRATLGGMIANNACGAHSVAWGTTADNVRSLDVLLADGTRVTVTAGGDRHELITRAGREGELHRQLTGFTDAHEAAIRRGFGRFTRQISGYALHELLPEHGYNVAALLCGSEGGFAATLRATVALTPMPAARVLCVLGFADSIASAECVPAVLAHRPLTMESINDQLVDRLPGEVRRAAIAAGLPGGRAWVLVEMGGEDLVSATAAAEKMLAALKDSGSPATASLVTEPDGAGRAVAVPHRCGRAGDPARRRRRSLGRLGGCRGSAAAPRRLSARPGRDHGPLRAVRGLLWALRRGLHAHAHRLRPAQQRGGGRLPGIRGRGHRSGGGAGWFGVRGARRRPGPLGDAGPDVRRRRTVIAGRNEGHLGSGAGAQPGGHRGSARAGRGDPPRRSGERPEVVDAVRLSRRPPRLRAGTTALRRHRQVPPERRRGDVSELPGHPRGAALHPRARAPAVGDAGRRCGHRRLALHRGARRAGSLSVLQGVSVGLPRERRHGHLQGRIHSPPLCGPTVGAAAVALVHGLAAGVVSGGGQGAEAGQPAGTWPAGETAGWHRAAARYPGVRRADVHVLVRRPARAQGHPRLSAAVAGQLHRPPRPAGRAGRRRGARGRGVSGRAARRPGVLRADLDLHRSAHDGPQSAAEIVVAVGAAPGRRHPDRRAGTQLHRGASSRRPRTAGRRPAGGSGRRRDTHLRRVHRRVGLASRRACTRRHWCRRTAISTPCSASTPTAR